MKCTRETKFLILAVAVALTASRAGGETLTNARYDNPVERYGHFALGRPHEYARIMATTDAGRELALRLPADEVFEDLAPRLVRLAPNEPVEILSIVSRRDSGARLVMIGVRPDGLTISAQSQAIGTPRRWLNPVGAADLDGDGRAEIAAVITPHIGGTLKVYKRRGRRLVETAALEGFSNHIYGTAELGLSAVVSIAGRPRLLVPDTARLHLRVVALERGSLIETGRCSLPAPLTGAIKRVSPREVSVRLGEKRQVIVLTDCRN